jgi:mRNA interferase HicA
MKYRDFTRHLLRHGCRFHREGGNHEIWRNTANGRSQAVPRHTEVSWRLARAICKKLDIPIPTER